MNRVAVQPAVQLHLVLRDVRQLALVVSSADADVALHFLHAGKVQLGPGLDLLLGAAFEEAGKNG
ncbi:hypothetical protein D3C73_1615120 [compost metagenome]